MDTPPDCCVPPRYKGTVSVLVTRPTVPAAPCASIPCLCMPGLQSNPHPPRLNSYRGRIEAPVRSAASQARTTHRGRLNPRAQHPKQLGRSAGMPASGTKRACRAQQACRGCEYSGKGEREARGHLPPPQRGSYRALDALGLRRGVGCSPVGKG